MVSELAKPCSSAEDVAEFKRTITRYSAAADVLREAGALNRSREELLVRFRFAVPDGDADVARRAAEWPRRFGELLREANARAAAEGRRFRTPLGASTAPKS